MSDISVTRQGFNRDRNGNWTIIVPKQSNKISLEVPSEYVFAPLGIDGRVAVIDGASYLPGNDPNTLVPNPNVNDLVARINIQSNPFDNSLIIKPIPERFAISPDTDYYQQNGCGTGPDFLTNDDPNLFPDIQRLIRDLPLLEEVMYQTFLRSTQALAIANGADPNKIEPNKLSRLKGITDKVGLFD